MERPDEVHGAIEVFDEMTAKRDDLQAQLDGALIVAKKIDALEHRIAELTGCLNAIRDFCQCDDTAKPLRHIATLINLILANGGKR